MTRVFVEGETFRGYTVEKLLGEGGLGSVWLARHGMLDSRFAIKILDRDVAREKPEYVKRFIREAKLASQIRHPNLVAVHDVGYDEAKDAYFLVMDYVQGDTLRIVSGLGGPVPEREAAGMVMQIAGVLDAAQHFGLVHRDLKPENIMVVPDGTVRLLDLGVAKVARQVDSLRTMATSVFGTPSYIAPEQAIDSSTVDARADIYSLGIILFELLAGRRPYEGDTPAAVMQRLLSPDEIPDVRESAPDATPAIAAIVAKMCAKRADARYSTPAELLDAFRSAGYSEPSARPESAASGCAASGGGRSMAELIAASGGAAAGEKTLSEISLSTEDPEIREFIVRRRRIKTLKTVAKIAAGTAAAIGAFALAALRAVASDGAGAVKVSDCVRDPEKDVWAAADVKFAREVMSDVFAKAGVETKRLDFGEDAMFDGRGTEVLCSAFRTPSLCKTFDFPLQPLGRMHFGLYATRERAKRMLKVKITEWPTMRVGYSPVSQGADDDRERYFEQATLNPEYREYPESASAVAALKDGEIDMLFLYTPEGRRPEGLVEIVPIGSRNVYFAVRKGKGPLFGKLKAAYRECYIDNVAKYDALRERLLGVPRPEKRVRIAAYERGSLFGVSPSGERSGIVEEWLNAVAGHARWNLDYVYGDYEESLADVASGRLDIVGGLGFSVARSEMFLYPHTPIGMLRAYLWAKRGSRFKAGDQTTWRGMRVGILKGALSAQRVVRHMQDANPGGVVCVEYPTDAALMDAYFAGDVDTCVDIEMPALDGERALHSFASHPMYLCVSPKRKDVFIALELALDEVCDDFSKYMRMITERHYGIRSEMSALTFREAEWLKERVKDPTPIMIDFSPWPVNLKDESGRIVHFAGAFLAELEKRTGLKFDTQPQTGIQTATAKFLRGDTQFWIPYPEKVDVASMGGTSVFSMPVPKTYAHMLGTSGEDEMEMWAGAGVPQELVGVIRKSVARIEPQDIQEMFIKAAAERSVARRLFGMTDEEFERFLLVAGFAAVSLVAAFAILMSLLLRRQVKRANRAAEKAEEFSRAKTRFLAMMSHELRTPLNAVIGYTEFLGHEDCVTGRGKEYLHGIKLSSSALLDLINDILDLSKLDTGAMHMLSGECDVEEAMEELPAIFGYAMRRTGVRLTVRRSTPGTVPVLKLSRQGLKQILVNLVGNSAKFTEQGEIAVEYGWDAARKTLSIGVRDTGCGISAEKMSRLFDPFVQDIASRMKQSGDVARRGTGLGLPIVKRMVDAAGGTVDVSSEPGRGTSFRIAIPGLEPLRESSRRPSAASSSGVPEKVLVVDDIETNRSILSIHLRHLGVKEVRCADGGRQAVETMAGWIPDAILTDMWMPDMDGQRLAEAVRADPRLAGVPVYAITADVDVASTFDVSVFAKVVAKPVTADKLLAMFGDRRADRDASGALKS